ncbi:MAG TPA: lipopolysaccharide biosynthesis protein [Vicinamibacterales bacterium]
MTDTRRPAPSLTVSALWLLVGKTLGYAVMFLLPVLLVRRLSQHDFGVYKQLFLVISTAVMLLPLGFGMSAYYFLPRLRVRRERVALNILLVHAALSGAAAALLIVRPGMLVTLFGDPQLVGYAPLIGLVILLWIPSSCLETLAVANGEPRIAASSIVLLQLSKAVCLWVAAFVWGTVHAVVLAAAVHGVVQSTALAVYVWSRFPGVWRAWDRGMLRAQLTYALPLGAAGLLYWVQVDLHKYLVAHRFDAATFAIYAIGCFEMPLLGIMNESVGSVLIPRVSQLQKDGRRTAIIRLAAEAMRKLAFVYFPLFALLAVAGEELIAVLFTTQYLAAWPIFAINILLIPFSIPTTACDAVIRAYAEHRFFLVRMRVVSTVLMVGALWFGLRYFGLIGAISVVVGTNLLERLLIAWKAARVLQVSRGDAPLLGDVGKVTVAATAAGLAAAAMKVAMVGASPAAILVACAVVAGIVYAAFVLALRVPRTEEWQQVAALAARVGVRPVLTAAPERR